LVDEASILLSGHKTKGLEWETVYHLDAQRIPSPWSREGEALEQEYNVRYVIETRAKNALYNNVLYNEWLDNPDNSVIQVQAFLHVENITGVPGPIAGEGLIPLLSLTVYLILWNRHKKLKNNCVFSIATACPRSG
jgi:hypothetical protein